MTALCWPWAARLTLTRNPVGGKLIRRGKSRDGIDLTVAETGLEISTDQPHPLPIGFQSCEKGISGRVQPEAAEIEMGLGRRKRLSGEDRTAVGVPATGLRRRKCPAARPGASDEPDRNRGGHPRDARHSIQGKSPCLPTGGDP